MKCFRFLIIALLLIDQARGADPLIRQVININRDWRFTLGDVPGVAEVNFDDSKWNPVNLPHGFDLPYFGSKNFYVGYGCYRKHLEIRPEWMSKKIFVEFDGAFQDAELSVNGQKVGEHKGGFTGFSMEITSLLHSGDNLLSVRLNNNWNAQVEPRAGDHTFMGGIYRDVRLVVTDPLHVAWYGTSIVTSDVSATSATVDIQTEVINQSDSFRDCILTTDILDANGNTVARLSSNERIGAGIDTIIDQKSAPLHNPQLWHPSHPYLYTAVTTISTNHNAVDNYISTFGIRSLKWTADKGFFLNGEHLYFHGANVHEDHAGWGDAVTDYGSWRDVKMIKEAGLDFIRGSHYPHNPAFADACDRLGILFWSENCFWGCGNDHLEGGWLHGVDAYPTNPEDQVPFEQNALDTLRDEIRIFRNHPSIIVWSMCNEVFFSKNQDKVKGLLQKLVEETHKLDPSRPAAIGGCQRGGLDKLGDVAGYNGDGARLFFNPGIPNVVSEYGNHISDRGDPRTDTYDGLFHTGELTLQTPEYPWRSGQCLWCGFDYSTIKGHFGHMGFIDYFRIPKRAWYWYRNYFRHIPPPQWPQIGIPAKLALTTDKSTILGTDATDDCQIVVSVQDANDTPLSNSPPVKLEIESGPGEFPTGRSIVFDSKSDITIRDGLAAIEFRSYFGGKSVIRASSPGLQDSTLTITTLGDPRFLPGRSPIVVDRPYLPPDEVNTVNTSPQNVAMNHPTIASSEAPGHDAGLAIDGVDSTGWMADSQQPGAWWQVDMEGIYSVKSVETTLGEVADYRYKIETSPDGHNWTLQIDTTQIPRLTQVETDKCEKSQRDRFLRITFTHLPSRQPAVLNEVKIYALPSP